METRSPPSISIIDALLILSISFHLSIVIPHYMGIENPDPGDLDNFDKYVNNEKIYMSTMPRDVMLSENKTLQGATLPCQGYVKPQTRQLKRP